MRHSRVSRWAVGLALSLLASAFMAGGAGASQTKNYAYLFVQGRLSDPGSKTAMAGAQIRLTSGESSFEATTDPKGNFAFEKLPVATYLVHITTADGRVLERIEDMGLTLTGPKRYRASFAHGPEAIPVIVASDKDVSVTVPKPTVRWKRFWTQFAIFAGGALVLAL